MHTSLSVANVADELEQIAADLRSGSFAFSGVDLSVGGEVDFKKKQRLEGGSIKYEISLRIPLSSEDSNGNAAMPAETQTKKKAKKQRTNQDKQLKKKIAAQWKTLVNDINDKSAPDQALLAEFKNNCEQYRQGAPAQWEPFWKKCAATMAQAAAHAVNGDFIQAKECVEQAQQQKKAGHKKFK